MSTHAQSQVVIVGAGGAGDAAAFSLRTNGFSGRIALVGADPHRPYERPYLSKQFLRDEIPAERVFLRPPEEYERQKIELLSSRRVVEAVRGDKTAVLDDGRRLPFDTLILATGGTPRRLPDVPRVSNAFALRTLDDCTALKQALAESQRMLILGAGFIGAEVAASARVKGKEVLVLERGPVPLGRALGHEMGEIYARIHRSHGVDLRTNTSVTRWLTDSDRLVGVELSDGSHEAIDAVLVAIGIDADIDLARGLGLELGLGGVLVDETLRAAPDIFCAGDIAAHLHPVFGRHLRVEHWQVAQKQGAACGAAIAGEPKPYDELPWFWSDQYDINLQYVGNAPAFDQTVWRGDPEGERFSVFYLKGRLIEAVLSVNDGRTGQLSRDLIRQRVRVDPRALADPTGDLRELSRPAVESSLHR
jgi:3-phenylpropionate/trans-cinnamate dioxygenase ferredoxin reductase subunit